MTKKKKKKHPSPTWLKPNYQFLDEVVDGPYRLVNWNGFKVVTGSGKGPYFFNDIEERRNKIKSNIIIVTGSPGEGKSYFALRMGEIFDPKFNVGTQVVFERKHQLQLIGNNSPLSMGQVIMVDEAQYIAGARRWYEDIQKDVMDNLEGVRSKGFIIEIVVLHLNLLDVILRHYVLSRMIHMEGRGIGTDYELYTPRFSKNMFKHRKGKVKLKLPDYEKCKSPTCLRCTHRKKCMTSRAIYERRKRKFLGEKSKEAQDKIKGKELRKIKDSDIVKLLRQHQDKFIWTNRGTIDHKCMRAILREYENLELSIDRCKVVRTLYEMTHPSESQKKRGGGVIT